MRRFIPAICNKKPARFSAPDQHVYLSWVYHRIGQCDRRGRDNDRRSSAGTRIVCLCRRNPDAGPRSASRRRLGSRRGREFSNVGSSNRVQRSFSAVRPSWRDSGFNDRLSIPCAGRVNGVQVGADVARLNFGGSGGTLHVGLTSGQVETSALTNSSSTNIDFQVPFFGLYASLTYGNFFADAQIRGNFLEGSLTDNQNAVFGEKVNGRGFTVSSNIGYNYKLPGDWFIEPSAGVNWSRTFVDPLNVSTINPLTSVIPPSQPVSASLLNLSSVLVQDFDNLTGRASVRVGTTFPFGQYIFQPFATASDFHEFASPISSRVNTLDVATNSSFALQTGLFSTSRNRNLCAVWSRCYGASCGQRPDQLCSRRLPDGLAF